MAWEVMIGLECHAQLHTASKLFCRCPAGTDGPPNTAICPVCLGHPGALPWLNAEAVALGVRAARAFSAEVAAVSSFSRKCYFYPDLPKGFQITQEEAPLARGGVVHTGDGTHPLARMHLEEDAGKMVHTRGATELDWNRAGVPLLEIVTTPTLTNPAAAEAVFRTIHRVLVAAGVTEGDMERGQLRCDANVSVRRPGEPPGPRVEIKNLNSFRFLARALRFEVDRQTARRDGGEEVVSETRGWDGRRTVRLRSKEDATGYLHLPEPDLPALMVDEALIAAADAALPGRPLDQYLLHRDAAEQADWVGRYGLEPADVDALRRVPEAAAFFVATVAAGGSPRVMAQQVKHEVLRRLKEAGIGKLRPTEMVAVEELVRSGRVTREGGRRIIAGLVAGGGDPEELARTLGLGTGPDADEIQGVIHAVLGRHAAELARYRAGENSLLGFFIGQVMAATGRQADARLVASQVRDILDSRGPGGEAG